MTHLYAATISGHILDQISGEPLIGAIVHVEGHTASAVSGFDGSFLLKKLPSGTYVVIVNHPGFADHSTSVTLEEDTSASDLNIAMEHKHHTLEEVTIQVSTDKTTDESAIATVRNSDKIMNVVSARSIEISPDITVANVIQRVSGISIERNSNGDGQHAIIRGMDKRYNYTLVNGVKIPSPDDKFRYVPLDIFPAELLDRLEISKSLTPNMEGDAVGGVINMVMKDAPDQLYVKAHMATGFSELFTERKYLSFNSGNTNFSSPYEQHGKLYNASVPDFPKDRINYTSSRPPLNFLGGLSVGNRFFNSKLGALLAASYQNTYRGNNSLFFDTNLNADDPSYYATSKNERQYSEQQSRLGLHGKIDFRLSSRHNFQLYTAYLHLTNIQTRDVKSTGLSNGYEPDKGNANLGYSTRARLTSQKIYNSTLKAEHILGTQWKATWSAVYSYALNEVPDNTTIDVLGARTNFLETKTFASSQTRSWQHNNDRDIAGYLNLFYTIPIETNSLELSAGGLYRQKQRSNFYNSYKLYPADPNASYGKDFTNYTQIIWQVQNPRGSYANALTYDATENIGAGYLQGKLKSAKIVFTGGLRMEHTMQGYSMKFPIGEDKPNGAQKYLDLLPSLNIKYSPVKNMNWRASYFRSINRPGFFEIVPFKQVFEEYNERGNPNLKRATVENFDLRYELFPSLVDQVLVGGFYKVLHNPIEYTIQADAIRGQDQYYTPGNFGTAINYGFELDLIRYFHWLGIKLNYTYTSSSITTAKDMRIRDESGSLLTVKKEQTRPLFGQSAHIGNLTFLVKELKKGVDGQLSISYTGDRINTVSQYLNNDFWQKAFVQLDASVEKSVKHFTVFVKVNNLMNTPMTIYLKNTNSKNENVPEVALGGGRTLVRQDFYQRSYLLGIRYKL